MYSFNNIIYFSFFLISKIWKKDFLRQQNKSKKKDEANYLFMCECASVLSASIVYKNVQDLFSFF